MNNCIISENLKRIKQQIKETALSCGRKPEEIKLVVVTKKHSIDEIQRAIDAGVEYIGENQVQETDRKLPFLKNYREFHFIGHLQTNKIRRLLSLKPVLIHSLDKLSTAEKLNSVANELKIIQDVLIQVNVSHEDTKNGISTGDCHSFIKETSNFSSIRVKGLMTVGMNTENELLVRKGFRLLKDLFDDLRKSELKNCEMVYLSMGMSNDFVPAITEGANILRIGSAIMGERVY